jgi:asparagine synthase (glutamine-hydrolysing)
MFAFALWDERRRRLLLARDRVGKKPLFYYHRSGKFVFGSELKSILADKSIKPTIGHDRIDQYLKFGYIPAPITIYNEIHKLRPGHILVYEPDRDMAKIREYWSPHFTGDGPEDEDEVLEDIEKLLVEATRLRMIADVPLGAFLSGGVDSSLVVALMSRLSEKPVKTFSIGFREDDYSEIKYARQVARHLGTDHHEEIIKPDILETLQELVDQFDEPFGDSSAIPTFLVSRVAQRHVKVALSGDGGDEVFAGYNRYVNLPLARRLDFIPGIRQAANLATRLPFTSARARRKLSIIAHPSNRRQLALSLMTSGNFRKAAYTEPFRQSLIGLAESEPERIYTSGPDRLNRWQQNDIVAFLPNDILVKVDRASMLTSLETRAPLLDHHVIEYMARVPEKLRTKNNVGKYLLKKLAGQYVPREVLYRKKMGFSIPAAEWFRGPLKNTVEEQLLVNDARTARYLNPAVVKKLCRNHMHYNIDNSPSIYTILYLEMWLRKYAPNAG